MVNFIVYLSGHLQCTVYQSFNQITSNSTRNTQFLCIPATAPQQNIAFSQQSYKLPAGFACYPSKGASFGVSPSLFPTSVIRKAQQNVQTKLIQSRAMHVTRENIPLNFHPKMKTFPIPNYKINLSSSQSQMVTNRGGVCEGNWQIYSNSLMQ